MTWPFALLSLEPKLKFVDISVQTRAEEAVLVSTKAQEKSIMHIAMFLFFILKV